MTAQPRSIVASVALYRLVLHCYPAAFRRGYGAEMIVVFRDSCRDAYRQQGTTGVMAVGVAALADLIVSVLLEWVFSRSSLSRHFLVWCGFASIASGVLWILAALHLEGRVPGYTHATWHLTLALAALLSLVGLVGLYTRYGPSAGRAGQFGLLVADLGAFLSLIGNTMEGLAGWLVGYVLFMLGLLTLLLGLIIFGLANWSHRGLPRWSLAPHLISAGGLSLAMLISLAAQIAGVPLFEETSKTKALINGALIALFGLGWITLGLCLWSQRDAALAPSVA